MKKKWSVFGLFGLVLVCGILFFNYNSETQSESTAETKQSDNEKNVMNAEQKKVYQEIKKSYDPEEQETVYQTLNEKKASDVYTPEHMLIEYNPFGTNTSSLYVCFTSDTPVSVSYTIHVADESIADFTRTVYQENTYQTEHEFQVIGLIPDMENTITFTLTSEDGTTADYEVSYDMGSLLGEEKVQIDTEKLQDSKRLEDGLYVILGNDSNSMDFMYYYDNDGVLRGEVPILGYRSHRLIFDDSYMYYSISEKRIAQVNRQGQVMNVYQLGNYKLHHDYTFDDDGNILVLATDTTQDSTEDVVIKLNVDTGEVTEVLDMGDLLSDYKKLCQENSSGEFDWIHINTIQYTGDDSILLSSRETSTIIKIDDISSSPSIAYMICEKDVWKDTPYEELVFSKSGDFTIQGGQHSITCEYDASLSDGQYYLYMFNNNIGISETRPDFDWSSVGLTEASATEGEASYYYKYLVDENAKTFQLVDSFEVPYSGYVSSVQDLNGHTIVDSGLKGTFTEYDENHEAIATYQMDIEKFIYRVYKYDFNGFYFSQD